MSTQLHCTTLHCSTSSSFLSESSAQPQWLSAGTVPAHVGGHSGRQFHCLSSCWFPSGWRCWFQTWHRQRAGSDVTVSVAIEPDQSSFRLRKSGVITATCSLPYAKAVVRAERQITGLRQSLHGRHQESVSGFGGPWRRPSTKPRISWKTGGAESFSCCLAETSFLQSYLSVLSLREVLSHFRTSGRAVAQVGVAASRVAYLVHSVVSHNMSTSRKSCRNRDRVAG